MLPARFGQLRAPPPHGLRLAHLHTMVIPLFVQVTGFKVENLWRRSSRSAVRCTARLTRPLLAAEVERVERLPSTEADRAEVVHECRPEEVEDWHQRLVETLAGAPTSAARSRAAVAGGKKSRRAVRKRSPEPFGFPGPAA